MRKEIAPRYDRRWHASAGFFKAFFGTISYSFALTDESNSMHDTSNINQTLFLDVLKAIIGTLDPTLRQIVLFLENIQNTIFLSEWFSFRLSSSIYFLVLHGKIGDERLD